MKTEDWMNRKWRPTMAWVYMAINVCDFIVFPILFSIIQYYMDAGLMQWQPITLQAGGLIHLAFGAILGITAWGRSKEKLEQIKNGKSDDELEGG
jgi:hypothetical protein